MRVIGSRAVLVTLVLAAGIAAPAAGDGETASWVAALNEARAAQRARAWDAADEAFGRALSEAERGDADDPTRIEILDGWANAYRRQGLRERAALLEERAVELRRSGADAVSMSTVRAVYRLATLRRQIGPWEAAETALRRALALRERIGGGEVPDVGQLLSDLAGIVARSRREDPEIESLLMRRLALGDTAADHRALADHFRARGRLDAAIEHQERALELERNASLPSHERQAAVLAAIARVRVEQGRVDEAEALMLRALALREESLGEHHPRLAHSLQQLGSLYLDEGRDVEAEALLERALALDTAAWGERGHRCGCGVREMLARIREATSLPRETESDEPTEPARGDDAAAGELLERIAALRSQGAFGDAATAARELAELARKSDGETAPRTLDALLEAAQLLRRRTRHGDAIELFDRVAKLSVAAAERPSERLADALEGAAGSLRALGRDVEAQDRLLRELAVRESLGHAMRAAWIEELLAGMARASGDLAAARMRLARTARTWSTIAGDDAPEIVRLRVQLATSYVTEERYDDAAALLAALGEELDGRTAVEPGTRLLLVQALRDLARRSGSPAELAELEAELGRMRAGMR